ncbi:hypothetical protein BDY19DRAFT_984271 [Irpex rosettiformis]|uniref:Uncharacterized protein n=1 Tax=Irpex rosettiformis TaxID=378272 RepID=A0ACB8U8R8_9APHY|nr:hypothetical protein BDY19DRAFT_984271 [Irpex rosettiformis]
MGVHGLTTYLRANHAAIAQTRQFTSSHDESSRASFVIDGWSFIYEVLSLLDLPWVYGGEYAQFSSTVKRIVQAWLRLGLKLYFVFDGPYPPLKFPTLISRTTENTIKPSLLFFRTSPPSRSKPKFLRECTMLPPRAYTACVQTLRILQHAQKHEHDVLEMHFADEEGDPYAVELAGRVGAYVVGNDSDFVILNVEGYLGYVPLDDMLWSIDGNNDEEEEGSFVSVEDDADGFQTVVSNKSKRRRQRRVDVGLGSNGIVPPDESSSSSSSLQLSITIYAPSSLASHLQLPLSLLPLLATLVGNDFTNPRSSFLEESSSSSSSTGTTTSKTTNLEWLFFDRHMTSIQRITRVSNTLRGILKAAVSPPTGNQNTKKKKKETGVSSVMELIDRAVGALIVRNTDSMASGERERVVERVVEATLQYAIPKWGGVDGVEGEEGDGGEDGDERGRVCALHEPWECPFVLDEQPESTISSFVDPSDPASNTQTTSQTRTRAQYVEAYRTGHLDPHTLDVLHTGTFWYRHFLESPDVESVSRTFGRPIMVWVYAILDGVVGIPRRTDEEDEEDEDEDDDDDEDELIDVVEETDTDDDDPLAPLRGALQQLNGSSSLISTKSTSDDEPSSSSKRPKPKKRKVVEEYVRRGTRLVGEPVEVPPLDELLSSSIPVTPTDNTPRYSKSDSMTPLPLRSTEERVLFLLRAVGTPEGDLQTIFDALRGLPAEQRIPLLTLRYVLSRLRTRALESGGSREREKERWTREEARAFLASFAWSAGTLREEKGDVEEKEQEQERQRDEASIPPIVDRNVQLTAQILATTDAIERLAECLFLSLARHDEGGSTSTSTSTFPSTSASTSRYTPPFLPPPTLLFSGQTFHAYLTHTHPIPPDAVSKTLWEAACVGLEDAFGEGGGGNRKRKKDKVPASGGVSVQNGKKTTLGRGVVGSGKFGLLAVE